MYRKHKLKKNKKDIRNLNFVTVGENKSVLKIGM